MNTNTITLTGTVREIDIRTTRPKTRTALRYNKLLETIAVVVLMVVNLVCVVSIVWSFNPADLMLKVWNFQEAVAIFRAETHRNKLGEQERNAQASGDDVCCCVCGFASFF